MSFIPLFVSTHSSRRTDWAMSFFLLFLTALFSTGCASQGGPFIPKVTPSITSPFPFGITRGPDGALWFTEADRIGRMTPQGHITEFFLPGVSNATAVPTEEITTGPDGALWFTDEHEDKIERITVKIGRITVQGKITQFTLPTRSAWPEEITTGPDGALWFAEANNGGKIGRITVQGKITEFALPATFATPNGITAGPDGALWFTEANGGKIGRISIGGKITEFALPPLLPVPSG